MKPIDNPTLAFIGAGNMASSLIGGWFNNAKHNAVEAVVHVADNSAEQLQRLAQRFDIIAAASNSEAVAAADVVVLAVKPHIVEAVCLEIAEALPQRAMVISVAAGVRLADMQRWLATEKTPAYAGPLVRCMPNTPALLGAGASGLFANTACSAQDRDRTQSILESAGKVVWVEHEAQLDAVTALSGSGPAYFFHLIECMASTAESLGLDADDAVDLAIETAYGAAMMARQKEHAPAILRENVTSKGGTTAAALASFQADGFAEVIARGMQAAQERAKTMGDEYGTG